MSQLSLFSEAPIKTEPIRCQPKTKFYIDVFVQTWWDEKKHRIRLSPLGHQSETLDLCINSTHKARKCFPIGTIFKMDLRLAQGKTKVGKPGKSYLIPRLGVPLVRAVEFFDQNINLQKLQDKPII